VPGQLVEFTRNPYFREWSPAAQPAGYPDRIVVRVDGSPSADIAAVLKGQADWTFDQPTASQRTEIQLRAPRLLHTESAGGTDWIDLNTHSPPFDDLRVRQALNFAIDRNAIVKLYGGPAEAIPTCQIIPPTIPGYVPYCPYTRDPSPSGRWSGPDLARARRLIAASGTRGDPVTLVTQNFWTVERAGRSLSHRSSAQARLSGTPADPHP
jgi:peptide/nickel transport system substrate-binding protein